PPISCTAPFQLNQQDAGPLSGWGGSNPTGLARLPDGKFVAVWTWVQAQSPYYKEIHARVFNDDGTPYTNEFTVNAPGSMLTRLYPMARAIDADKFVVTWLASNGIRGRVMDVNGSPLSADFCVTNWTIPPGFKNPQVASAWDSRFRISWIEEPAGGEERYVKWIEGIQQDETCPWPPVPVGEYIDQILGPKAYPSLHAACWCDTTAIGAWAYKCTGTTFPQCVNFRIKAW
ncbi:MAG: hypothetical protein FJ088_12750, partial [Deltaproteobacteria bacterium]|nr:hypothetical protein [Deltaproteobacteria bacterium]